MFSDCAIILINDGFTWTHCSFFLLSSSRPPHDVFPFSSALLIRHCSLPPSYIPLLCQSVELAFFHFLLVYMNPASIHPSIHPSPSIISNLRPSIPQAACCVGECSLPLKMSGLAVLLPSSCSVAPSLPAWMGHHHLVREGVQRMVHNLHFHRVVGRQIPQCPWGKTMQKCHIQLKSVLPQVQPVRPETSTGLWTVQIHFYTVRVFAMCLWPVMVSVRSWSLVFLSSRTKAGTPSQFLIAILLSGSLPNEMFFRAPQAACWT